MLVNTWEGSRTARAHTYGKIQVNMRVPSKMGSSMAMGTGKKKRILLIATDIQVLINSIKSMVMASSLGHPGTCIEETITKTKGTVMEK
jgi:hypothetical protein